MTTEELLKECEEIAGLSKDIITNLAPWQSLEDFVYGMMGKYMVPICSTLQEVEGQPVFTKEDSASLAKLIAAAPRMASLIAKLADKVREQDGIIRGSFGRG